MTQRYRFVTKSLTGIPDEYPTRGNSPAQVVHVKLKPITRHNYHPDFHDLCPSCTSPFMGRSNRVPLLSLKFLLAVGNAVSTDEPIDA